MYEWNGSPEPHIVGFRDLVGTGIAPVSKKTAVKGNISPFNRPNYSQNATRNYEPYESLIIFYSNDSFIIEEQKLAE